ncbi:MAG TPA: CAP domain-containing protein, partial [Polyangiaceae bacterium]
ADARANLEPLPTRVDPGTRLHFQAQLLVPSTQATLVVLGPQGPPQELRTTLAGDRVEASFFLDTPGLHQIQLMVDDAGGPGAAVEAWVGVGRALPARVDAEAAPGEGVGIDPSEPERALLEMANVARAAEGLPALTTDPRLAALAHHHAEAMHASGRLEHDLGDGNPRWRLEAEGLLATTAGENLARAPSLARAHRAIWASPSHRANLLNPHFDKVGIGVARSVSGDWWVCELLADLR